MKSVEKELTSLGSKFSPQVKLKLTVKGGLNKPCLTERLETIYKAARENVIEVAGAKRTTINKKRPASIELVNLDAAEKLKKNLLVGDEKVKLVINMGLQEFINLVKKSA